MRPWLPSGGLISDDDQRPIVHICTSSVPGALEEEMESIGRGARGYATLHPGLGEGRPGRHETVVAERGADLR